MISQEMINLGTAKSIIRELAGFGAQRAAVVGAENVLDFSLGNPSVPAPNEVKEAILDIVNTLHPKVYHSYSAGPGHDGCRTAIANNLNRRFGTDYTKDNLFMTCGAAASLSMAFKALISSPEDEIVILVPFFPEYTVFIKGQGGKPVIVPGTNDMQLNLEGIKNALNPNTKAVLINTPNNPAGVIYSREEMEGLCKILEEKSNKKPENSLIETEFMKTFKVCLYLL